jgi:cytochrome P450
MTTGDPMSRCDAEDLEPLSPETFDSPYERYAELRRRCPVAHSNAWNGFWALLKYEDVYRAASDARTYVTSVQNVIPKVAFTGRRPPLHLDPPEHTPYRKALNPLLSASAVARLETPIRRIVEETLQPLLERGHGEIITDYSSHLTIRVFAEWMSLSAEDTAALSSIGRSYNLAVQSSEEELVRASSMALYAIAERLVRERRVTPQDPALDPVTALVQAQHDGRPLPEAMIIGTVRQVLVVGIVAPTIVIGSIVTHLCRNPALQSRLRAQPEEWPDALEEFLRLYTPYRGFARTVTREIVLQGRTIKPGEPIALVFASANRDEAVFPDPDEFILNRANAAEHLAFGRGPHHCVGAALARLELRIALERLLAATTRIELAGPVVPTRMPEIGAVSVPVRLWR